jgi:hypothetical protein
MAAMATLLVPSAERPIRDASCPYQWHLSDVLLLLLPLQIIPNNTMFASDLPRGQNISVPTLLGPPLILRRARNDSIYVTDVR